MLARTSIYDQPVSSSIGRLSFMSAEGVSSAGAAASCALRFFPMVATPAAPRLVRRALQRCARCGSTRALACLREFLPCDLAVAKDLMCVRRWLARLRHQGAVPGGAPKQGKGPGLDCCSGCMIFRVPRCALPMSSLLAPCGRPGAWQGAVPQHKKTSGGHCRQHSFVWTGTAPWVMLCRKSSLTAEGCGHEGCGSGVVNKGAWLPRCPLRPRLNPALQPSLAWLAPSSGLLVVSRSSSRWWRCTGCVADMVNVRVTTVWIGS